MTLRTFLLLAALLLSACTPLSRPTPPADAQSLPPITQMPTGHHHPGKIVWHDLLTPRPKEARRFYSALFGWTFQDQDDRTLILHRGRRIGGLLPIHPERQRAVPAQWLVSLSVPDVDRAADRIPGLGGKVINGPISLGARGRGALVSDPAGAHLVLLQAKGGDPADHRPDLGEWLWDEAWVTALPEETKFYRTLAGYSQVIEGPDYVILVNEGRWRAGLRKIDRPTFAGRWVAVVRVDDPAALADRVGELGGTVWLRPGEGRAEPDKALIADPDGALLILQRWTFAPGEGEQP